MVDPLLDSRLVQVYQAWLRLDPAAIYTGGSGEAEHRRPTADQLAALKQALHTQYHKVEKMDLPQLEQW